MDAIHRLISPALTSIVRPAPLTIEKVLFAWRMAVGPALARVSRVKLGEDRILVATLDDGRWRSELDRSAVMILARMQDLLGSDNVIRLEFLSPASPRPGVHRSRSRR